MSKEVCYVLHLCESCLHVASHGGKLTLPPLVIPPGPLFVGQNFSLHLRVEVVSDEQCRSFLPALPQPVVGGTVLPSWLKPADFVPQSDSQH